MLNADCWEQFMRDCLGSSSCRSSAEKLFFEKLSQTMFRKHQNAVNASIDFALLNPENNLPLHDIQFT